MRVCVAVLMGHFAVVAGQLPLAQGAPPCEVYVRIVDGDDRNVVNRETVLEVEVVNRGDADFGLADWLETSFLPNPVADEMELPSVDWNCCPRLHIELASPGWKHELEGHGGGAALFPGELRLRPGEGGVARVSIGDCFNSRTVWGSGTLRAFAIFNGIKTTPLEILADLGPAPPEFDELKLDDGTEPSRRFRLRLEDYIRRLLRDYGPSAALISLAAGAMVWISRNSRAQPSRS